MPCCVLCFESLAQGELWKCFFLCRTSSRPSGSVPSAPSTSLFAETSLGVSLPGSSSSSSSSLPLGGQGKRGGSRGAPSVCSDRILTCRIKSIRSPAKVGLVVTDLITSPVVSWEGWETPPPPALRLCCHSLLNHRRGKTSLLLW